MRFFNWIFHEARSFIRVFKPDNSLAFLSALWNIFSLYQKLYSQAMGNAQNTFSSMLFTFLIKPEQDKNINLSNFLLKIEFRVL